MVDPLSNGDNRTSKNFQSRSIKVRLNQLPGFNWPREVLDQYSSNSPTSYIPRDCSLLKAATLSAYQIWFTEKVLSLDISGTTPNA